MNQEMIDKRHKLMEINIKKRKILNAEKRYKSGKKWAAIEAIALSFELKKMPPSWANEVFISAVNGMVNGNYSNWNDALPRINPRGKQYLADVKKKLLREYLVRNTQRLRTMVDPVTKKRYPIGMPLFEVMATEFHVLHPQIKRMGADTVCKLFYELQNAHLIRFEEQKYSIAGISKSIKIK